MFQVTSFKKKSGTKQVQGSKQHSL